METKLRDMTKKELAAWKRVVSLRDRCGRGVTAGFVLRDGKYVGAVFRRVTDTNRGVRLEVGVIDWTAESELRHPEHGFALRPFHHAVCWGGGYDMLSAALAGAVVDGHTFVDHGTALGPHQLMHDRLPEGWMFLKGWNA